MTFSGQVLDAETKAPLPQFRFVNNDFNDYRNHPGYNTNHCKNNLDHSCYNINYQGHDNLNVCNHR